MVALQPLGQKSGGDALEDRETPMDKGSIGLDEEGPVEAGDETGHGSYDGAAYKAAKDDAHGSEVNDAAAGTDVPVGAADGHDGEEDDKKNCMFPAEVFGRNGFPEKGGTADQEEQQQENRNAEPDMLYTDDPRGIHGNHPFLNI